MATKGKTRIAGRKEADATAVQRTKSSFYARSRALADVKRGLAKARQLFDYKRDLTALDPVLNVMAELRIAKLLAPYRAYLRSPSPETYATLHQQEGFFAAFLWPVHELPMLTPSSRADRLFFTPVDAIVAGMSNVVIDRMEDAYARLYHLTRAGCVEARAAGNFPQALATAVTVLGPRIRMPDPLSRDPILLEEEQLWLTNRAGIPRGQRREAQRLLRSIAEAPLRGATPERRPPLPPEKKLSHKDAEAVSKAVRLRMGQYAVYRRSRTAEVALDLIERALEESRRFVPPRKVLILDAVRRAVEEWEQQHAAQP